MKKTFNSGIYLSESEPSETQYVLMTEDGEFYSEFSGAFHGALYFLKFSCLPKNACCFESKAAASNWKRKNKKWITQSKHTLTVKPLEIYTTTTYIVK